MKNTINLLLIFILLVSLSGCAYLKDRNRDALDIFTATIGKGVGVKARVGPIAPSLIINEDIWGIRNGDAFFFSQKNSDYCPGLDWNYIIFGAEMSNSSQLIKDREKEHQMFYVFWIASPNGCCVEPTYSRSYFTQIEALVGLGVSLRLGVNPGELLDFILGWTTFDIYGDDIELNKKDENLEIDN